MIHTFNICLLAGYYIHRLDHYISNNFLFTSLIFFIEHGRMLATGHPSTPFLTEEEISLLESSKLTPEQLFVDIVDILYCILRLVAESCNQFSISKFFQIFFT